MKEEEFPKKIADNVTMHSSNPILYVVDNFLSNDECDAFIEAGKGRLKPSTVISPDKHIQHKSRTSENCWIQHDASEILHEVSKRFSILVQMPIRNAEQYQLVYYKEGAEYKPHFDSFDFNSEDGKKNWEPGGQRLITALGYLNNVEAGGGTDFPELGVTISPRKGDVVIFHNALLNSESSLHAEINPRSLHGGMPVIKGEKWVINLWFRENLRY